MSLGVGVPIGIVGVDYKYRKSVLIYHLSDAVEVNLKVFFRNEIIFADLKLLVDGADYVPWEARPRKQNIGFRFSQNIDRKLDGLFASNSHKHIICCDLLRKVSV